MHIDEIKLFSVTNIKTLKGFNTQDKPVIEEVFFSHCNKKLFT